MEPVKGNSLNRSCGDVISSNCVTVPISIAGVCGPNPTLTQVLTAISDSSSSCCEGSFPSGHASCYTGSWVDFSTTIPTFGSSGGGWNWSISAYGSPFPTSTGTENNPSYKWTRDGDLKVRGSFRFDIISTGAITDSFLKVPLVTLPTTCFPTNGNYSQTGIVTTDAFVSGNGVDLVTRGFLTIEPSSGTLYFNFSFASVTPPTTYVIVHLGCTTFNLA